MKKFWIVLLALGLVAGFAMSASAADVKFSGSYYVYGMYVDNPSVKAADSKASGTGGIPDQQAAAFWQQRLRIQTEFKIAEGLSLVTRFDALEKAWGQGIATGTAPGAILAGTGWRASNGYDVTNRASTGTSGARAQENIEWERAYIDFTTKIGRFNIGYQNFIAFGTMFLDTHVTIPGIKYFVPVGPLTVFAAYEKRVDQSVLGTTAGLGLTNFSTVTDSDYDVYDLGAIYKFGAGDAGIIYQYGQNNTLRNQAWASAAVNAAAGSITQMHIINPYVKMKFGPVYVEAEGVYGFGDAVKFDSVPTGRTNISGEAMGLYLNAKADFGPAYVGGIFAYMRGDDPNTSDKKEGGFAAGLLAGQAWDPCLILWNDALYGGSHRLPTPTGYATDVLANPAALGVFFDNAWLYQIYAGFKPVKGADIMMSVTYSYADKKPKGANVLGGASIEYVSDVYGTELDLVAKYQLFDNLEYMIGGAYLWTGDYFKGNNSANKIDNNYMLIHKLTLSF